MIIGRHGLLDRNGWLLFRLARETVSPSCSACNAPCTLPIKVGKSATETEFLLT